LDYLRSDGSTLRQHFLQAERLTGKKNPKLAGKPIPPQCSMGYKIFVDLSRCRGDGAISYADMDAWSRIKHYELSSTEVEMIQRFDQAFLKTKYEIRQKENNK
jgi:hypothetical protein